MKNTYFFLVACIIFLSINLAGCERKLTPDFSTQDIEVGIIETRGNRSKSRIIFYNDEIEEIGDLPLPFATVGGIFYIPLVSDNKLYVIPQGYAKKKDERKALEINLQDLSVNEYKIEQIAMNAIAADNDSIYTCNNLNGISYINKCYKENNVVKTIEIPKIYISNILYANNKLYAFGTGGAKNGIMPAYLYLYSSDLELIDKIDISSYGTSQYRATEYHGDIYFTSLSDTEDKPTNIVSKFNDESRSIETIQLNEIRPLDVAVYDGRLFVTHFNLVQNTGGGLSIYNLKTGELNYYKLEHGAAQMAVANNKIYILSDWKIYIYDIDKIELIKSIEVNPMDNDFSYLSGMFVLEKYLYTCLN